MTTTVSQEAREARIARYLSDEKAARESLATYPESTRQRLEAWQSEQSEWFSDTILEIVAEFITIDDAIRQSAERGEAWRPIETAPRGNHVLINCRRWGVTEAILGDGGWQGATFNGSLIKCDPTHWQPLPTPPEAA